MPWKASSKLTRQSLKRGVFRSVDDLESAITRYIAATNRHPKPFVWTARATGNWVTVWKKAA